MDENAPSLAPPPETREGILARVETFRRRIYQEIRAVVDELEEAAPWPELLVPSSDGPTLLASLTRYLEVTRSIPHRVEAVLRTSGDPPDEEGEAAIEEARFYFRRIQRMVDPEVAALETRLETLGEASRGRRVDQSSLDRTAELTVDLKGKHTSALMGAAASLVAEGRWDGVGTGFILFPEKEEERDRSRRLLEAVHDVVHRIRDLPYQVDFLTFYERWSNNQRVEKHALAELPALGSHVGKLLQADLRRALYSGDFQAIQLRSEALGRLGLEMESLHRGTWGATQRADGSGADDATYERMKNHLMEIAAVVDLELLEILLGRGAVRELSEAADLPADEVSPEELAAIPADRHHLLPWFRIPDLLRFLEVLKVNIQRRAGLEEEPKAPPDDVEAPAPEVSRPAALEIPAPPTLEFPSLPSEGDLAAVTQSHETGRPLEELSDTGRIEVTERLALLLDELRSPANRDWQTVQMFHRLLSKHRQVPPALMEGIQAFVYQVTNDLVPLIETAASFGALPSVTGARLMSLCVELSRTDLSVEDMTDRIPRALDRFTRLLDAVSAATRSLQANRTE